jgi:predicted negative regulator of RcsB-dependent stress response
MQQGDMILEKHHRWAVWGLLLLTIVVYSRAVTCGYIWDDDYYVTNTPVLKNGISGLYDAWFKPGITPQYYPMVFTTYWIEHQIWDYWAGGFHFTNILIHGLSVVVLYGLLQKIGITRWVSLFAAMLFAIHPVHVESVAWITERKNVLSGLFYLSAATCYLTFIKQRDWRMWGVAFALFLCALLSKTVTCTLPAALLLYIWYARGKIGIKDIVPTLPFWIIGIGMGLLTVHMEKTNVGAVGHEWELDAIQRFLLAGRVLGFYAWSLIWPYPLAFTYPKWTIDAGNAMQWAITLGVLMVLGLQVARAIQTGKRGRTFALLFFAGTLFPALGFFDVFPFVYSYVADHFQYLASIGILTLMAFVLARYPLVGVPVIIVFCALTFMQIGVYKDAKTLWLDTIAKNPNAWMAHTNLGVIQIQEGNEPAAIASFQKALEIKPDYAEALANMGAVAMLHERYDEAREWFAKALASREFFYTAHVNMAIVQTKLGHRDKAIEHFQRALQIMDEPNVRHMLEDLQNVPQ